MFLSRIKQTILFRLIICGVRIPFYFIVLRGHISKKNGLSVNREGQHIPWITDHRDRHHSGGQIKQNR